MIRLSPEQSFSPKENQDKVFLFQDWNWSDGKEQRSDLICIAQKGKDHSESILIYPENVLRTYGGGGHYTNFVEKCSILYESSDENWLSVRSPLYPIMNFSKNSESWEMSLNFDTSIREGLYKAKIVFTIEAKNPVSNRTEIISEYEIPVTYKLFDENLMYKPLSVDMYVTDSTESGYELELAGNNYEAIIPEAFEITGSKNITIRDDGTNWVATGSGAGSITLRPKALTIDNTPMLSDVNSSILIRKSDSSLVSVPLNMKKIPGYFVKQEKISSSLIVNPNLFDTVLLPESLIGQVVQVGPIKKWKIKTPVKSIDKISLNPELILVDFGGNITKVPFPVKSQNFVQFTSPLNKVNFTKTLADINFTTNNNNDHFEVDLFVSGKQYLYKVPAFKGKGKINLGDAIHRNLSFDYPDTITGFTTFPLPNFDVFTRHIRDGVMIGKKAHTINPILKGWNPIQKNDIAILSHCKVSRHSKNSFTIVNIMWLGGYFSYRLYINGVEQYPAQHVGNSGIASIRINFKGLGVQDGDVVDFELKDGNDKLVKTFIIQPTLESKILMYEDSFGLRSVLECTGLKTKLENKQDKKYETAYNNHFFHQQKFNVSEENTLTLNTGFLLQSQFIEIEELLNSPVVKLYKNDSTFIDLIPKTEKTVIVDKQKHLKSYQLEFHINQKKYAQDYKL